MAVVLVASGDENAKSCPDQIGFESFREAPVPSPQRERVGQEIYECATLLGRSKSEVRNLLGPPGLSAAGEDAWEMGSDGFLDNHHLFVVYGPGAIVRQVTVESG